MSDLRVRLLIEAIDRMTSPVRRMGSAFRQTTQGMATAARNAAQSMQGITDASKKMNDIGKQMALRVTAPIVGFGALTIKTAADFELAMNKVQALSGATSADLERLRGTAKQLGLTTQFSASQAADAMGQLALAGFDTEKTLATLPGVLQLAASAQIDLADAASIVANTLGQFRLSADQVGRVNDVLVKAFTSTKTDLGQLADAMKYVGTVASSAGVEFEETAAALGLMANVGVEASMAGTGLRGALSRLSKEASETKSALGGVGIKREQIFDSEGRLRSLTDIVRALAPHADNTGMFMQAFGDRAGPAMAALVSQGADALEDLTKKLRASGGTAERIAEVQMKGAAGATKELRSAFEGLQLAIAESGLLEWFTAITRRLTGWLQGLSGSSREMLKMATIVGGLATLLSPLLVGLAALGFAMKGLVVGGAVLKVGMIAMAGGFAKALTAFHALGVAFTLNPLGAAIAAAAALAAAAYLIYKNWEPIKAFFENIWGGVVQAFDSALASVRAGLDGLKSLLPQSVLRMVGLDSSASAPPTRPSALPQSGSQRAEVGGVLKVEIESDRPARVTELRRQGPMDIDVDTGHTMILGMP